MPKEELEQRAWRAMVTYALFRWESGVVIAMTILLSYFYARPFPWWPVWGWLVLGSVAEGLILWTSITDARTGRQVVADMLRERYNPSRIRTKKYRQQVERALIYRRRIDELVAASPEGVLRDHLGDKLGELETWLDFIYRLAERLDRYAQDALIEQDRQGVRAELGELAGRLRREDSPEVRAEIEQAIAQKQRQRDTLEKLQDTMEKAAIQLGTTVSALGTVYSQMQLIGARRAEGKRAERLRQDIADQVNSLQDLLATMDEVYRV
jgi:hypothetical protein